MIAIVCIVAAAALLLWPDRSVRQEPVREEKSVKRPRPRARKEPKS